MDTRFHKMLTMGSDGRFWRWACLLLLSLLLSGCLTLAPPKLGLGSISLEGEILDFSETEWTYNYAYEGDITGRGLAILRLDSPPGMAGQTLALGFYSPTRVKMGNGRWDQVGARVRFRMQDVQRAGEIIPISFVQRSSVHFLSPAESSDEAIPTEGWNQMGPAPESSE